MSADFTVLSEVGSKDNEVVIAPSRWVASIQEELNAGSWKVITEARESGTAGIFRGDGEVRMGLIEEIVTAISPDKLIFEAPQKAQQVWFIQTLGSNVSVGNIPPDEVLPLESLRLGLRADTLREIHGGRETD
jgi:phosphosulfolactate synthase